MNAEAWFDAARSYGFLDARWTSAAPVAGWRDEILRRGMAAGLAWMTDDPAQVLPGARAVWVLAMPYLDYAFPDDSAIVSGYYFAQQRAYVAANALVDRMRQSGMGAALGSKLPHKPLAARAGLGAYGRNGQMLHPAYGWRVALQIIVVDRDLHGAQGSHAGGAQGSPCRAIDVEPRREKSASRPPRMPSEGDALVSPTQGEPNASRIDRETPFSMGDGRPPHAPSDASPPHAPSDLPDRARHLAASCAHCAACIPTCPTRALDATSAVDIRRCLRESMFQGTVVPEPHRAAMGRMLIGCDVCRHACPNDGGCEATLSLPDDLDHFRIPTLLDHDKLRAALPDIRRLIGSNYGRERRIVPQALIVAGNMRDPRHLPLVVRHIDSPDEAIRTHARWAVARIANP